MAWIALVWGLMLGILVVQGIAVFGIRHPQQPSFGNLLGLVGTVAVLPLQMLIFMAVDVPLRKTLAGCDVLYAALWRADSAFAPHAEHQPEPLPGDAVVDVHNALPEYPLRATRFDRVLFVVMFLMVLLGVAYLILVALITLGVIGSISDDTSTVGLVGFTFTFGLAAICSQFVLQGRDALWPPMMKSLAIDDRGIRWREEGQHTRDRALAWRDMRAFCVQKQFFSQSYLTAYTYLLIGQEANFGWIVWQSPKAPEYRASGLLGQLVVTKTGLPLLDISENVNALGRLMYRRSDSALGEPASRLQAELEHAIASDRQPPLISEDFERQLPQLFSPFNLLNALAMALLTLGFCVVWLLHG